MVELEALEFSLQFSDLLAIGVHLLLGALPVHVYLLYDDFGATVGEQALDTKHDSYLEAVYESLVLGSIVCGFEK